MVMPYLCLAHMDAQAGGLDFLVFWAGRCCMNARDGLRTFAFQVLEFNGTGSRNTCNCELDGGW